MRDKSDHEATAMMKAQFMSLWDGKQIVTQTLLLTLHTFAWIKAV